MDQLFHEFDEALPFYVDFLVTFDHDDTVYDADSAVLELVEGRHQGKKVLAKNAELTLGSGALELRRHDGVNFFCA